MITIRLARHGAKKKPFYWIVVADSRMKRDGRFIEKIGFYQPKQEKRPLMINLNLERVKYWKTIGAQCSLRAYNLIKKYK
ncbi:MAG: 30S ribosomal protein S16 [Deltaproteobacteria bacterium]|nr:MAG: 30S ribosomal protein S16 [Deltaproteobacteria bacterium]